MNIANILQAVTLVTAVLLVLCILLQARGASLGAGFGSSGELFTTRRGIDKSLYEATIVLVTVFVLSILANLLLASS
ncbi:MAG TPA: preprotein translocase subunit SecG [Candidatus Saccharimonadales bacterium]|jgi:preprotein translocase subunit SecG